MCSSFSLNTKHAIKNNYVNDRFLFVGGLYLVSCGSTVTRLPLHAQTDISTASPIQNIAVSGSSMSVGTKLQSLCDLASLEQFKRLHLSKYSSNENILPSPTPSTPKWEYLFVPILFPVDPHFDFLFSFRSSCAL